MSNLFSIETTPNPSARLIRIYTGLDKTFSWRDTQNCPPIVSYLLSLPGIVEVTAGPKFLTVRTESPNFWQDDSFLSEIQRILFENKESLSQTIILSSNKTNPSSSEEKGATTFFPSAHTSEEVGRAPEDEEIFEHIQYVIDRHVRPYIETHGGEIVLISFTNGVVKIALRGACSGCPAAGITLRVGIERILRHYIREISKIEAENCD